MPPTGSRCDAAVMDHLLLLRMLTLSSRRTAELEARAATSTARSSGAAANDLTVDEKLSSTSPETHPHTHVGVDGGHAEKSAIDAGGAENGTIVMGTVLLSGPAERGASEYAEGDAHTPQRQASSAAEVSQQSPGVRAAASHFDSDATGLCVAVAGRNADEPATPLTPMSPMSPVSAARRALEKGARPVRRPRASPANASISATSPAATTAHARTCSTGSGNGAALDAATAAKRREVVRRTLSSLGLPTSAISPARAAAAAAAATADADGAAETTAEAKSSLIDANTTTTSAAAAPTPAPAAAAGAGAASSPSPAASTRGESDAASSGSPTVAHTFSTFLQLLRPAPPTPSLTPAAVSAASASLPVSKTNRITTLPTTEANASLNTPPMPPAPAVPLLSSVADSTLHSTTSSCAPTALAAAAAAAGAVPVLPLPPPPPPPYSEAAAPQITPGAGTFHSAQELLAHVRLQLRWTVVAAQQRRRCRADGGADATEEPPEESPTSTSSLPLPGGPATAGAAQAEVITSPTLSCASSSNPLRVPAALTAPAVATTSGASSSPAEVTLVSDRVDAVLPTWAYLSSHIADAAPPAFVLAVTPATTGASAPALSRGDSMTLGATNSAPQSRHRRTLSHASSVASSVAPMASPAMLPTAMTTTCVTEEQGVDRQACLFPYTLAEACALARLRQQARPGTAPCSSLHLLRLELLVEVQHIPPTVRNVTPAERQAQMEQALEEFAQTGVLPTTVLRGVLNDAALRLLTSVDDEVLHRVAGEHRQGESPSAKGDVAADSSEASRHAVVPLSVQVRTLQGDATVAPGPQRPLPLSNASIHSATASTASGDTDSLRHPSLASAALMTTPMKLTITVLLHVLPALREDAAEERTEVVAAREKASEPVACSRSTASSPDAGDGDDAVGAASASATAPHMEEATAISLARVVVPHLLPLHFSLSRYTTCLSLSTAVNYDVLRGLAGGSSGAAESSEEAAEGTRSARQDGSFAAAMDAPAAAAAAGGGGSQPWSWQELSITAVREACGLPELRPLPTPATPSFAATPAGGLSRLVRVMAPSSLAAVVAGSGSIGAANGLASPGSSVESQLTLASRRSRKRLTAPASPAAAVTPAAADSTTTNTTTTTTTDAAVVEVAQAPCAVEPATVRSEGGVAVDAPMGALVNAEGAAQTAADSPAASEGEVVTVAPMSVDAARPADEPDTHEVRCEILLKEQPVLVPDSATATASLHAAEEEGDEFDEGGAISESLRRWDVAKETAELTAVAEAVHAKVDAMCGHAGLLRALMEAVESGILEASTPSAEGVSESRRGDGGAGRRGRGSATTAVGCTPPRTDGQTADTTPGAYRRYAAAAAQRVLLYSMSHLVRTGLLCDDSGSPPSLLAGLLAAEEESAGATKPMPRVGTTAAAAAAEHANGVARQLPRWFARYAAVLAERVCAPLEQLETYISETTSSAVTTPRPLMAASVSVEDGTASNACANGGGGVGGAVGYGTAADEGSGGRRVVVGAQVVVKESRRQRRQAAAAARGGAVADLVQAPQRDVEDHDPEPESATDTSMLPALCIAKAAVHRCRMMGDASPAAAAGASVSQAPAASPSATAAVGHDGEESQEQTPTTSTASLAGLALHIHPPPHYRSVSSSSFTSMRVAHAAATAAALHPLQERVAPLLEVMQVVLRQLDAEEQRWAALQVALTCLRTAWGARLELLNKEGLQRGTLMCAALMRQEGIGRRAVRTAEASAVAKLRDAKRADALAQAAAAPSRVGACTEQAAAAAATATLAGVAPSSMPDLSEADTVPDFAVSPPPPLSSAAPAAARALAEVCKATATGEEALLSPSPPTPSNASGSDEDEVDGEEGASEMDTRSSVAATETSTTAATARRRGSASVDAPSTPAAATRNGHTSYATATGQRAAPQRTAGSQQGARGRRARQGAAAPARAQESASAVDAMRSTGTSGGQNADSTASASRALLVRPQPGAVALPRVDAVVLRQAAPFVAVGAVLLFLLLLL